MSPCDKGFKSTIFLNPIISDAHIKKNQSIIGNKWPQWPQYLLIYINVHM